MGADRFGFWQRWLFWACISTVVLGVSLAFFDTRLLPFFSEAVSQAIWSLYFGAWPNVVLNLVSLLFVGTPLVFTRRAFRRGAAQA